MNEGRNQFCLNAAIKQLFKKEIFWIARALRQKKIGGRR